MVAQAGLPVNFSAVFPSANPNFVAMSVYDDTGATPVLLLSPVKMNNVHNSVFSQKFTPANGKLYVVFMAVYTDGTFGTLDGAFNPQSATVEGQYLNPPVQRIVGVVNCQGENS